MNDRFVLKIKNMRKYKSIKWLGILIAFLLGGAPNIMGTNPGTVRSIFDLMYQEEALDMTLEVDLDKLEDIRRKDEEISADLSFTDVDGVEQWWKIKVKVRGKFRRVNCMEIPPLKLNFKKSELKEAGLAKWDDLKLVPQCVEDKKEAREFLRKEFLAYKLYNQVSDYSFRVQLLNITYIDRKSGEKKKQRAFLIEDTAQLRARLNAEKCEKCLNLPLDQFYTAETSKMTAFQYLIGNGDWSIEQIKNVKLLRIGGEVIPVPYDFDFSGMVNASYSTPNSNYGARSVQERIYLGPKELFDSAEMKAAIQELFEQREELMAVISNAKFLSRTHRGEVRDYLEEFFKNPVMQLSTYQPQVNPQPKSLEESLDK